MRFAHRKCTGKFGCSSAVNWELAVSFLAANANWKMWSVTSALLRLKSACALRGWRKGTEIPAPASFLPLWEFRRTLKEAPHLQKLRGVKIKTSHFRAAHCVEDSHKLSCLVNQAFRKVTHGSLQMWKHAAAPDQEACYTLLGHKNIPLPKGEKRRLGDACLLGSGATWVWMPITHIQPDTGAHICNSSGPMWGRSQRKKHPWTLGIQPAWVCLATNWEVAVAPTNRGWGGVGWGVGWDSNFPKLKKANRGLFHSGNPPVSSQQSISASNTHPAAQGPASCNNHMNWHLSTLYLIQIPLKNKQTNNPPSSEEGKAVLFTTSERRRGDVWTHSWQGDREAGSSCAKEGLLTTSAAIC